MVFQKLIALADALEDPKYPLLGPMIKGLYLFGLWQTGSKFRTVTFNMLHFSTFLFVVSQFVDLYTVRDDINKVLNNMSLTVLSVICVAKCVSYVIWQAEWKELVQGISEEELLQMSRQDEIVIKLMAKYTKYTRIITYLFWIMVIVTNSLLIASPLLKYLSSKKYREEINEGLEPPPQIMSSWFPFNTSKMPGYLIATFVHILMGSQGSGVLAAFDMNAVSIMSYLKGQLAILRVKCADIFDGATREEVLDRIKECHRHHNVLLKHYTMFNSLLSPTMFLYVLICSITICCSVVQFTSKDATTSQKIWVVQYTTGQISQLFLYCWHSNEIAIESRDLDRGVYESDWWKGDVMLRRQVLLLSGKLTQLFILDAGPYTTLSVPTFIDGLEFVPDMATGSPPITSWDGKKRDEKWVHLLLFYLPLTGILKGSYSFYTLFSQMQGDK